MPELSLEQLEHLATEVFPSLTALGLVGRGEPTVVTDRLWNALVERVIEHRVFLTMVTNGSLLRRRISDELLPFLETLTVSIDGGTAETFARHRGGASLDLVLDNVAWYHERRQSSGLMRRPRLGFSWTLMRNNVAEFPRFIERVLEFEPDLVYARHLLVFFEKTRADSLLDDARLANPYLQEAYELMAAHGIRSDCPPLMNEAASFGGERVAKPNAANRDGCMFIHRTAVVLADGEVPTCSAPFAALAGRLSDAPRFVDVWNGQVLRDVRAALNTDDEWAQCRNCWYREGRYQSQRLRADTGAVATGYDLTEPTEFTTDAWDFRSNDHGRGDPQTDCSRAAES